MDSSPVQEMIDRHQPFEIETASGRRFQVPHPDFVHFSPRRTSLFVFWEDDGEEHFAIVPLLTITSLQARSDAAG